MKWAITLGAIAVIFSILNQVGIVAAGKRAKKEQEKLKQLEQVYNTAQAITERNRILLKELSKSFNVAQDSIKKLNRKQAEITKRMNIQLSEYNRLKQQIKTNKTNFQDSSKTAILNNLPK